MSLIRQEAQPGGDFTPQSIAETQGIASEGQSLESGMVENPAFDIITHVFSEFGVADPHILTGDEPEDMVFDPAMIMKTADKRQRLPY